jgi:alkylation response protein AidB-like acyl-CoA dehydrogenase
MSVIDRADTGGRSQFDELQDWLGDNWDPDLTVGEWWDRLGMAGWSQPILPRQSYGRAMTQSDALAVQRTIVGFGALGPPVGLGLLLAAPTIATHGTREQIERFVPGIVTGRTAWCQLFSEPGAGSDLAGLTTRAVRDGGTWVVNGQKVWTSGGHLADLGMLLARSDPDAPKHQGITWFALDMHQPGVEVRPLREMTGRTLFSEVFMTDAVVDDDARIGDANNGWTVANTTLLYERTGMGSGGAGARLNALARPGTVTHDLGRRAGDLTLSPEVRSSPHTATREERRASPASPYIELARSRGVSEDPLVRQGLAQMHILGELTRMNTLRHKAVCAADGDIPGLANFTKLAMADILRLNRDLGLRLLGATGMLHAYDEAQRDGLTASVGTESSLVVTSQALAAQALPIFGGTDQIQRNIIGERVLGLPKEPGDLSRVPFSELPRNG